jgi:hypothetical protein
MTHHKKIMRNILAKSSKKIANPLQRWTHKHCDKCKNRKLKNPKNKHEMLKTHDVNALVQRT